jgi:hypothetical protein
MSPPLPFNLARSPVDSGVRSLRAVDLIMRFIKSILVLAVLSSLNFTDIYACTCIGPADAKEALELSKAVFSGRVIRSNEYQAEVEVERVWKGRFTKARIIVLNPAPQSSCSIVLARGQRYIVFATIDRERRRIRYVPQICFPTSVLSKAERTLKEIGEGEAFSKRGRLSKRL